MFVNISYVQKIHYKISPAKWHFVILCKGWCVKRIKIENVTWLHKCERNGYVKLCLCYLSTTWSTMKIQDFKIIFPHAIVVTRMTHDYSHKINPHICEISTGNLFFPCGSRSISYLIRYGTASNDIQLRVQPNLLKLYKATSVNPLKSL